MTNTLTTNIIRNVYNIGMNTCTSGPQTCADGYALYFPCLMDITKGQEACFDFYVADYAGKAAYDLAMANGGSAGLNPDGTYPDSTSDGSGQELLDLKRVDAISLNLIGAFNCPYGTFSYPDNISSLQTEEYPPVYRLDFGERRLCHLSVFMVDVENPDTGSDFFTQESDFYSGTEVEVAAYDTPQKIFIGWALLKVDEDDCPDETLYDNIISRQNVYKFVIESDLILLALYRPRKSYRVMSDPENKFCMFFVDYDHIGYNISNRDEDTYDDDFNVIEDVLEGYHMVVKCIPSTYAALDSDPDDNEYYKFIEWKDHNTSRCRLFKVGVDTIQFEDGNDIKLYAKCVLSDVEDIPEDETIIYMDVFDEEGIHINTEFTDVDIYDYYGDGEYVIYTNEVYQKFIKETGYLYFNNGTLVLSSTGIKEGIKINLEAKAEDSCDLTITVNGYDANITLSNEEFKLYEIYFGKCGGDNIEIKADGECLIDMIEVCKEEFIDKGKARLCLPPEVTANLPSGPLSVNGAIMVDGKSYGLATTQIGTINKLPKITING